MAGPGKEYVIGKGKVFVDIFPPGSNKGEGERYTGNSPGVSLAQNVETLDHYDADQGLNVKDEQVTITNELTGTLQIDNISPDNVAMWVGGEIDNMAVAAATAVIDPQGDRKVKRGRWYQLGTSEAMPDGTRKITNLVVSFVVPPVPPATVPTYTALTSGQMTNNLEIDLVKARVYIEDDAPDIPDDTELQFKYDQEAVERSVIISKGTEKRGSMRYISDNPVGANSDWYIPYCKFTANGDFALKGDEWLSMTFDVEVLKKDANTERLYIDNVPAPV